MGSGGRAPVGSRGKASSGGSRAKPPKADDTFVKICYFLMVFSERELTFTFAICYRPSVCRLSVVCNVRAPYSGGCNFWQYFCGIRYLGHPLTSTKNFTEIVPGEPLRRGS